MSTIERRQRLLEVLYHRRHDTYHNLANEFNVSRETIRNDVMSLMSFFPLETVRGRYGGGVKVSDWYYHRRKILTPEQVELLTRMSSTLEGHDRDVLHSILGQFSI